jgi:L-threonylcarbamoyladenylate synthase
MLAQEFWPGSLTLVLPKQPEVPDELTQGATVGIRVPNHKVAQKLLKLTGPMAVTSANLSGGDNTLNADEVMAQLNGRIDLLIDGGQSPREKPSTVVDLTGIVPKVLREGPVSEEEILAALE